MDTAFRGKEKEWSKIMAQARADEELKKRLVEDSTAVLKENAISVPRGDLFS